MMKRQQVPPLDKRPETGPMRFGDDWTGIFLRGDCALGYRTYLLIVRESLPEPQKSLVNGIIEILGEADERLYTEDSTVRDNDEAFSTQRTE